MYQQNLDLCLHIPIDSCRICGFFQDWMNRFKIYFKQLDICTKFGRVQWEQVLKVAHGEVAYLTSLKLLLFFQKPFENIVQNLFSLCYYIPSFMLIWMIYHLSFSKCLEKIVLLLLVQILPNFVQNWTEFWYLFFCSSYDDVNLTMLTQN